MFRTALALHARAQLHTSTAASSRLALVPHVFPGPRPLLLRTFASGPSKPKPKESTPLRRAAAASQPIRSNPTPTRSEIQSVFTLSTAERYDFHKLRERLPSSAQIIHEAWWIPKHGKGEIFVFPNNGSFVCWGLSRDEARKFAGRLLGFQGVEVGPLKEPETEELDFVVDPSEQTRLQGDLIILGTGQSETEAGDVVSSLPNSLFPQHTIMARYAFSQALSRSTSLSALEVLLEEYLSSVANLPHSLEKTGKPGLGRRELIKKLGELMKFRQGLNLSRENFADTPDLYWAQPVLEGYFHSVSHALEIKARTKLINEKITYAAELQSVLRQLLTETSASRMELIIILLIAAEVIICLIRDGPELWNMLFHPKNENHGKLVEITEESSPSTTTKPT